MTTNRAACSRCERPVADGAPLCTECGKGLRADLRDIPSLVSELTTTRSGQGRASSGRVGGASADTPIPIRITGRGALVGERAVRDLELTLIEWARRIAESLHVSPAIGTAYLVDQVQEHRGRGRSDNLPATARTATPVDDPAALSTAPASVAEQCAVWLAEHWKLLRRYDDAPRLAEDLYKAIKQLRTMVDPVPTHWVGACSATGEDGFGCGNPLRAVSDATAVRCNLCGTQHPIAALQATARADAEDMLATIPELIRVTKRLGAPVPKQTLYWWASRGHIQPRGWQHGARITDYQVDPTDRPVFRLGDILARAAKADQDQQPEPAKRSRKGKAA
ncbi:hypothetical protein ACFWPK_22260 [Nocardia sp. NPDC058519]|uniref:hypothetical protein n=1 Tax=Nocardia sp. NPDC058519 TaxID=3346535 RepID=UPI003656BF44